MRVQILSAFLQSFLKKKTFGISSTVYKIFWIFLIDKEEKVPVSNFTSTLSRRLKGVYSGASCSKGRSTALPIE